MAAAITVRGVSKRFVLRHNRSNSFRSRVLGVFNPSLRERREDFWVIKDVDLQIEEGETVALLGPNGSGKSTLLKLIASTMPVTQGWIKVNGRVAPMIELGLGFNPELNGRDNIHLNASLYGLTRAQSEQIYPEIVAFSELGSFIDVALKNYSSGMRARLAFSVAAHLDADILLIDEVLAVGDEQFQKRCMQRIEELRRQGKTMVFVSHDANQAKRVCSRAALLVGGRVDHVGSVDEVVEVYRRQGVASR